MKKSKLLSNQLKLDLKNTSLLKDTTSNSEDSSWFNIFFLGFAGGLLALLTPCVFPMIPLTVSFFTKQSQSKSKGIANAILYGLFIVLTYVLLSVPFHLIDGLDPNVLNTISTNIWLNIFFFWSWFFFSGSFFGYYEITLPSSWGNKMGHCIQCWGHFWNLFYGLNLSHHFFFVYRSYFRFFTRWIDYCYRRNCKSTDCRNEWFWSSFGFTLCLVCAVSKLVELIAQIWRMVKYNESYFRVFRIGFCL